MTTITGGQSRRPGVWPTGCFRKRNSTTTAERTGWGPATTRPGRAGPAGPSTSGPWSWSSEKSQHKYMEFWQVEEWDCHQAWYAALLLLLNITFITTVSQQRRPPGGSSAAVRDRQSRLVCRSEESQLEWSESQNSTTFVRESEGQWILILKTLKQLLPSELRF